MKDVCWRLFCYVFLFLLVIDVYAIIVFVCVYYDKHILDSIIFFLFTMNHVLLLHISTDRVMLWDSAWKYHVLPYVDLERSLPKLLHTWYEAYCYIDIVVINGPWSFTSLRIGSLVLNVYQTMWDSTSRDKKSIDWWLRFWDIGKLDIYSYMAQQKWIPPCGYVFMWQRKKLRFLENSAWEPVSEEWKTHAASLAFPHYRKEPIFVLQTSFSQNVQNYFIDDVENHPVLSQLDLSYRIRYTWIVRYASWSFSLTVSYQENSYSIPLDKICPWVTEQITPRYMIDPQIG